MASLTVARRQPVCLSVYPSVCPFVSPVTPMYSETESLGNFKFGGGMVMDTKNWESKFEV